MNEAVVVCDVQADIATVTINRPKALNALNSDVLDAIRVTVEGLHGKVKGIIVTGAGDKAFVAGADIAEMVDYGPDEAEPFSRRGQDAFQTLQDFPGPTVAAIGGFALGGGLELAMACDILIAGPNAKLGLPESTLGVVPGFGGTQRLPRRVGPGRAKRLMFTGEMIDAETAHGIGLVDEVADDPYAAAKELLEKAARNGPLALAACKKLVNDGMDMDLEDAIRMEAESFGHMFGTADQKEGMQAFREKRRPKFSGS